MGSRSFLRQFFTTNRWKDQPFSWFLGFIRCKGRALKKRHPSKSNLNHPYAFDTGKILQSPTNICPQKCLGLSRTSSTKHTAGRGRSNVERRCASRLFLRQFFSDQKFQFLLPEILIFHHQIPCRSQNGLRRKFLITSTYTNKNILA